LPLPPFVAADAAGVAFQVLDHSNRTIDKFISTMTIDKFISTITSMAESNKTAYQQGVMDGHALMRQVRMCCWNE
jgi:hypothetical protein